MGTRNHKHETDWLNRGEKTLEQLEKRNLGIPENESRLVTTCHNLRRKPLNDFEIEDLRIMIGQSLGMLYLIPIALERLKENILAEGDYYEGDLLKAVLTSNAQFWKNDKAKWKTVCDLFKQNEEPIRANWTSDSIRKDMFEAFEEFERIN